MSPPCPSSYTKTPLCTTCGLATRSPANPRRGINGRGLRAWIWGGRGLDKLLLKVGGREQGCDPTMAPKTVLITGCSSGIGLALAARLAQDKQRRFRVIATMRDTGRSAALVAAAGPALGTTLHIKQLDVCDEGSIRACVDSIPGRHIDVLGEPRDTPATASPCALCWGHPMP